MGRGTLGWASMEPLDSGWTESLAPMFTEPLYDPYPIPAI